MRNRRSRHRGSRQGPRFSVYGSPISGLRAFDCSHRFRGSLHAIGYSHWPRHGFSAWMRISVQKDVHTRIHAYTHARLPRYLLPFVWFNAFRDPADLISGIVAGHSGPTHDLQVFVVASLRLKRWACFPTAARMWCLCGYRRHVQEFTRIYKNLYEFIRIYNNLY